MGSKLQRVSFRAFRSRGILATLELMADDELMEKRLEPLVAWALSRSQRFTADRCIDRGYTSSCQPWDTILSPFERTFDYDLNYRDLDAMTGRERKGRIGKNIVLNIVSCEKLNIWELSISILLNSRYLYLKKYNFLY